MKRWNHFLTSLALDQRVDFEEGDIGLPGGAQKFQQPHNHIVLELNCEKTLDGVSAQWKYRTLDQQHQILYIYILYIINI